MVITEYHLPGDYSYEIMPENTLVLYDFFSEAFEFYDDFDLLIEDAQSNAKDQKEFEKVLKNNKGTTQQQINKASNKLKSYLGIDLVAVGKDVAVYAAKVIKDEGLSSEAMNKIKRFYHKQYEDLADQLAKDTYDISALYTGGYKGKASDEELDKNKVGKALVLLMKVIMVQSILSALIAIIFPAAAMPILAVVVAPITEENAKMVAIKGGFTKEFSIVFNAFELTNYTIQYAAGVGLSKMVAVRLTVIGMHLSTTLVQYLAGRPEIEKLDADKIGIKLKESEKDKPKNIIVGQAIAKLMHAFWNAGGGLAIDTALGIL